MIIIIIIIALIDIMKGVLRNVALIKLLVFPLNCNEEENDDDHHNHNRPHKHHERCVTKCSLDKVVGVSPEL